MKIDSGRDLVVGVVVRIRRGEAAEHRRCSGQAAAHMAKA